MKQTTNKKIVKKPRGKYNKNPKPEVTEESKRVEEYIDKLSKLSPRDLAYFLMYGKKKYVKPSREQPVFRML